MLFKAATTVATVMTGTSPWWAGVPTKLIRKTPLVRERESHLPVYTLTFEIPKGETFTGRAQPHKDIRLDLGDVVKIVVPGYKPKSYSVSALREKEFDVTFKVYPGGRASGYLDSLRVGDYANTFGMRRGATRNPGSYVGVVAYGVGITEALPVAEAELQKGDAQKVVLLWASRTKDDTFWDNEISQLCQQYPGKFEVTSIYSREKHEGSLHGRINSQVLEKVFHGAFDNVNGARFLSVGTKQMMHMTDDMFEDIGFRMPEHALLPK